MKHICSFIFSVEAGIAAIEANLICCLIRRWLDTRNSR